MEQFGDHAVPAKLQVFRLHQRPVVDLGGPQGVPAVNQNHGLGDAAQDQGVGGGGVAAPHHDHRLAFVPHAVAGGAVGYAPAGEGGLIGKAQRSGIGPRGQHHSFGEKCPLAGLQNLGGRGEVHALHLGVLCLCAEALRLPLHLLAQGEAVDPLLKAGVVVDLLGQGHLPAGGELLQHQGVQPGPGGVEGRSIAAGPSAHHDHLKNMGIAHG